MENLQIVPATSIQRWKNSVQRFCPTYWKQCKKNLQALTSRQVIYTYLAEVKKPFLCLHTGKRDYCFLMQPNLIREILKHPRLGQGEFFGEGRQLWVIAEALGRYRMSKERQDAKQKRNILAHLLSNPERYIPKMQMLSTELAAKWALQIEPFFINPDLQEFTIAVYLKALMNFQGNVAAVPALLEEQIDLLGRYFFNENIDNFHKRFKELRNQLAVIVGKDPGLLQTTEYVDHLNQYIDEHYRAIQEEAFATGLNGALLAGYMAPYPAFIGLVYELGRNPEYQVRLRQEEHQFGKDFAAYIKKEDTLLHACVHEVLRLHPSQPFVFRSATQDLSIGGFFVKKGSELVADIYHVLRNPDYFGNDAENFYPERFFEQEERYRYPFLVYSSGPNNCTGQMFSRLSLKILLAELVKACNWKVTNGSVQHEFHFALAMNQQVQIQVDQV